jgi:hypothetical protein
VIIKQIYKKKKLINDFLNEDFNNYMNNKSNRDKLVENLRPDVVFKVLNSFGFKQPYVIENEGFEIQNYDLWKEELLVNTQDEKEKEYLKTTFDKPGIRAFFELLINFINTNKNLMNVNNTKNIKNNKKKEEINKEIDEEYTKEIAKRIKELSFKELWKNRYVRGIPKNTLQDHPEYKLMRNFFGFLPYKVFNGLIQRGGDNDSDVVRYTYMLTNLLNETLDKLKGIKFKLNKPEEDKIREEINKLGEIETKILKSIDTIQKYARLTEVENQDEETTDNSSIDDMENKINNYAKLLIKFSKYESSVSNNILALEELNDKMYDKIYKIRTS